MNGYATHTYSQGRSPVGERPCCLVSRAQERGLRYFVPMRAGRVV